MEKVLHENAGLEEEDGYEDDMILDLLKDLYDAEDPVDEGKSMFAEVLEDAKRATHNGGKFLRFTFTVKVLHVKSYYRINNVVFNAILHILNLQFPHSSVPKHYDEALSIIQKLGLGYVCIHVYPNNCVLFRKEFAKHNNYPRCNASWWKDGDGKRQIPEKVLPKRMFLSKQSSQDVQWHKLKWKPVMNELSHPADEKAWKDFDKK
jgi:hypothetical protein